MHASILVNCWNKEDICGYSFNYNKNKINICDEDIIRTNEELKNIIIQNDVGNRYSPTVIVSAITSQINKAKLPTHVEISSEEYGLNKDSVVLLEQVRTLDKRRLKEKIGHMTDEDMLKVNNALRVSLDLK